MQTRSKLMLLELVGGLFGWTWIIASVASVYFLIAALAFNGQWSSLFWAFGIGAIAKSLTRGLNEHQKRVGDEAELVKAQELVNKYGAVLQTKKIVAASEGALPAPKQQIKNALITLARHEKASGASPEALERFRVGYASLADFVSEHEAQAAITFENLAKTRAAELGDDEVREFAGKVADSGEIALEVKRQSDEAFARLTAEFDERVRR